MGKRDTRLVVEQDTVYELDMDCVRSRKKKKKSQKILKNLLTLTLRHGLHFKVR